MRVGRAQAKTAVCNTGHRSGRSDYCSSTKECLGRVTKKLGSARTAFAPPLGWHTVLSPRRCAARHRHYSSLDSTSQLYMLCLIGLSVAAGRSAAETEISSFLPKQSHKGALTILVLLHPAPQMHTTASTAPKRVVMRIPY